MRYSGVTVVVTMLLGCAVTSPATPPRTSRAPDGRQTRPKFEEVVKIEFPKEGYTFTLADAAKGVKIAYKVIVEQDYPGVIALPHGPSSYTPAGPSELHPLEKISGMGNVYCLLDFGLGAPPKEVAKTVKKGMY